MALARLGKQPEKVLKVKSRGQGQQQHTMVEEMSSQAEGKVWSDLRHRNKSPSAALGELQLHMCRWKPAPQRKHVQTEGRLKKE